MFEDSNSFANDRKTPFSAVFEAPYTASKFERYGFAGFAFRLSEPKALDTATIRAAEAFRNKGRKACVTATVPKTFVSQTAFISSIGAMLAICEPETTSI